MILKGSVLLIGNGWKYVREAFPEPCKPKFPGFPASAIMITLQMVENVSNNAVIYNCFNGLMTVIMHTKHASVWKCRIN